MHGMSSKTPGSAQWLGCSWAEGASISAAEEMPPVAGMSEWYETGTGAALC